MLWYLYVESQASALCRLVSFWSYQSRAIISSGFGLAETIQFSRWPDQGCCLWEGPISLQDQLVLVVWILLAGPSVLGCWLLLKGTDSLTLTAMGCGQDYSMRPIQREFQSCILLFFNQNKVPRFEWVYFDLSGLREFLFLYTVMEVLHGYF